MYKRVWGRDFFFYLDETPVLDNAWQMCTLHSFYSTPGKL